LLALVPLITRLVILRAAVPAFFRVTVCAVLVVPTHWFPKETMVGQRLTVGAVLVREKLTLQGAEKMASTLMAARKIAALAPACCSAFACLQDASKLRALPA
jgi:hypothetical protein